MHSMGIEPMTLPFLVPFSLLFEHQHNYRIQHRTESLNSGMTAAYNMQTTVITVLEIWRVLYGLAHIYEY